jgi:hypothetical protein
VSAADLVQRAERMGFRFNLKGGQVKVRRPKSPEAEALIEELRAAREEIRCHLAEQAKPGCRACGCTVFDSHGRCAACHPPDWAAVLRVGLDVWTPEGRGRVIAVDDTGAVSVSYAGGPRMRWRAVDLALMA